MQAKQTTHGPYGLAQLGTKLKSPITIWPQYLMSKP